MTHLPPMRERRDVDPVTPPPRRGVRLLRAIWSWWPVGLSVVLGLLLLAQDRDVVALSAAQATLVRIVFVTSVAGAILATFLRFVIWWFWTRRQP